MLLQTTIQDRIIEVVRRAGGEAASNLIGMIPTDEPNRLRDALATVLPARVIVAGTLERRLLLAEHPELQVWIAADLSGEPHHSRPWPLWARAAIDLNEDTSWISTARISSAGIYRLTRPESLLTSLYHPEYFPLPRFPLAISDLARAARSTMIGQVRLLDMQLGITLEDIVTIICRDRPDIVGVSATFGQHDLLVSLLDAVAEMTNRPLVIAGGSLTARNERLLLERYPWLVVARSAGEPTITDILAHWHGDLDRNQVRGIGFTSAAYRDGALSPAAAARPLLCPTGRRPIFFPNSTSSALLSNIEA